jgi:hypothetical protein
VQAVHGRYRESKNLSCKVSFGVALKGFRTNPGGTCSSSCGVPAHPIPMIADRAWPGGSIKLVRVNIPPLLQEEKGLPRSQCRRSPGSTSIDATKASTRFQSPIVQRQALDSRVSLFQLAGVRDEAIQERQTRPVGIVSHRTCLPIQENDPYLWGIFCQRNEPVMLASRRRAVSWSKVLRCVVEVAKRPKERTISVVESGRGSHCVLCLE